MLGHVLVRLLGLGNRTSLIALVHLLCATLSTVHDGRSALVPALHSSEKELRACGYAAIRAALHTQRQGLRSNRVAVAGSRAWFRACHTIPQLKRLNLPYRGQARPRTWERS